MSSRYTTQMLSARPVRDLFMYASKAARALVSQNSITVYSKCPKNRPDLGGIQRSCNSSVIVEKSANILPGDTKLSKKWSSDSIKSGVVVEDDTQLDRLQLIKQIFAYCVKSNARYGYLITDQELVVVRIRPGPQTDTEMIKLMKMSLRSRIGFIKLIVDTLIEQEMDPYKCPTSRHCHMKRVVS
jgi:hypothetical protein